MGRHIVVMKLICSLGHCECDDHTVHELSQRCLTADLLAPRGSDCSWMDSKVSSDCLPSYIKVMQLVLDIQNAQIFSVQPLYRQRPKGPYHVRLFINVHMYINMA
jgi:hypothetical protein